MSPPPRSQTGFQPHHRGGVRLQSGQRGRPDSEAADLGHGRAGALQVGGGGAKWGQKGRIWAIWGRWGRGLMGLGPFGAIGAKSWVKMGGIWVQIG